LVVHAALVASILVHPKAVPVPAPPRRRSSSPTPARNWAAAILWGVVVVALTAGLWIAVGRSRRSRRAVVIGVGLVAWLGVVFFFFGAVAPLLPASF
jgi:hypothetical protein